MCLYFFRHQAGRLQLGTTAEGQLKELAPAMTAILVRAIPVDRREAKNAYECSVYKTKSRGQAYIWTSLKSRRRKLNRSATKFQQHMPLSQAALLVVKAKGDKYCSQAAGAGDLPHKHNP